MFKWNNSNSYCPPGDYLPPKTMKIKKSVQDLVLETKMAGLEVAKSVIREKKSPSEAPSVAPPPGFCPLEPHASTPISAAPQPHASSTGPGAHASYTAPRAHADSPAPPAHALPRFPILLLLVRLALPLRHHRQYESFASGRGKWCI